MWDAGGRKCLGRMLLTLLFGAEDSAPNNEVAARQLGLPCSNAVNFSSACRGGML